MFNLDAPPGFNGLHPDKAVKVYTRNLPHWRQEGATYFVTFALADALPRQKRELLLSMRQNWLLQHPEKPTKEQWLTYARKVFRCVEKWMDAGYGRCWLGKEIHAIELHNNLLHFHNQRYQIGCFVVMANHCHVVIRPESEFKLEQLIGSIKSVTSKSISQHEGTGGGSLWQQESYDRIIRDEEHLYRVVQYIGANPRKAGTPKPCWHRWINPEWDTCGWRFRDAD